MARRFKEAALTRYPEWTHYKDVTKVYVIVGIATDKSSNLKEPQGVVYHPKDDPTKLYFRDLYGANGFLELVRVLQEDNSTKAVNRFYPVRS